jgi:hypothetical protein
VPRFNANLGSFFRAEVNERELLWPLSDWVEEYHARNNEILGGIDLRLDGFFFIFLIIRITLS